MKKKVLLVSPLPPPIGGIASWTINLLNYYTNNTNSEFEIFHQNTAIKSRKITDKSLFKRLFGGLRDALRIISEFRKNLNQVKPDIIHISSSASLALFKDLLIIYLANKKNIALVTHFHFGRIPELVLKQNWEWVLLKKVIKKSSNVIVIDEKSFNALKLYGFNNIGNVPNPISIDLELKAKEQDGICLNNKINQIAFVGHVIPFKGVYELVKSCSVIDKVDQLLIIGPYEESIKKELMCIARNGKSHDWLKFTGSLPKKEVLEHLANTYILALPSYTEGFPNVILEAMAMKCSIIGTNVGAIPEMLAITSDKPCGICVSTKNVNQLSNAILSLTKDTEMSKMMGLNGLKRVLENYTIPKVSKLYEKVWIDSLRKEF